MEDPQSPPSGGEGPRPVALSHHAVVMEHVGGRSFTRVELEEPEPFLELILKEVASAWRRGSSTLTSAPTTSSSGRTGR